MITFSVIQKSKLQREQRIDSQYFQPEYLKYENDINNTRGSKFWKDIKGKFITGPFGSEFDTANYILQGNYRYVRGKDVRPFFLLDNDNVYIPEKDFKNLHKYSLKNGDILISVVGTLGYTSIIDENILPAVFSCKSTLYRSEEVDPFYLIAYLNSKYGYNLLVRKERGANQTGLNIEDLKSLYIFVPKSSLQEKIGQIVKDSKQASKNSELFYHQAEELLLKELGLKNFQQEEDLSFVVNFSEVKNADRIDADFFQPKYIEILKKLKNTEYLSKNFDILRGKYFEYNKSGEIGVIKTKQLSKQFLNLFPEDNVKKETVKKENLPILQDSDVVFASMGVGSLGKTDMIYKFELKENKYTIDSTLRIFRKKNNNILPEVLKVFLSSLMGQKLVYKYIVGTSGIISIYDQYLNYFPIPILPREKQQQIADLVKKSHEARKKSKELLEQAKREVEEMIENQAKN